jgi:hypothetical protein
MTDHGVSDSDMPTFPWSTQSEVRVMDALLAGNCRPEDAPAELRPVAEVLMALQAPPDRREVAGWGEALTVYREMADRPGRPGRSRSRWPGLLSARVAAAAGAAAFAVLGGVAAAYTGSLPGALQNFAHATIGARGTSARAAPQGTTHPAGPSVTGPAAYGLCHAYQQVEAHGTASQRAVAFLNLVRAAGGSDQVAAYCASAKPGGATSPPGRRVGQTSSPTNANHGKKPTAPPGKPSTPPGKPSTPPGKPTATPGNGNGGGNGKGNGHGTQS